MADEDDNANKVAGGAAEDDEVDADEAGDEEAGADEVDVDEEDEAGGADATGVTDRELMTGEVSAELGPEEECEE